MEKIAWMLVGFIGGSIVGGVISRLLTVREYNKEIDKCVERNDRLANEIDDLRLRLDGKIKNLDEVDFPELSARFHDEDFDKHFEKYDHPRDDEPVREPCIISREEFDGSDRDTETLTYYFRDEILADESDDPITHPEDIIGKEALEKLNFLPLDEEEMFVYNEALDVNYHIYVDRSSDYTYDIE